MSLPGKKYSPGSRISVLIAAAKFSSVGMDCNPISPRGNSMCATNPQKNSTIPAATPPATILVIALSLELSSPQAS